MIKGRFLKTKVARRVFAVFLLSAIIPLICFAAYVWSHVNQTLQENASRRLAADTKAAAIIIQERLYILDESLMSLAGIVDSLGRSKDDIEENFPASLRGKFDGIKILNWEDESIYAEGGKEFAVGSLTNADRRQLELGRCLLLAEPGSKTVNRTLLARGIRNKAGEPIVLVALPRWQYLWDTGALVGHGADLGVALRDGRLLFSTDTDISQRPEINTIAKADEMQGQFDLAIGDEEYLSRYWMLFSEPAFGHSLFVFEHRNKAEIMAPLDSFKRGFVQTILLTLSLVALFCSLQVRRIMVPIEALSEATDKLGDGELETRVAIDSNDEFEDLGHSFNHMAGALDRNRKKFRTLEEIALSLSRERKPAPIIEGLVRGVDTLFDCDACSIHLFGEDGQRSLAALAIFSKNMFIEADPEWEAIDGVNVDEPLIMDRATDAENPAWIHLAAMEEKAAYAVNSILAVALRDHRNEVIGVMQLMNAYDDQGQNRSFDQIEVRMADSLASQSGVALNNIRLVGEFKNMFDSLIELLAVAIDEKSAYTGGHCRRVPILTMMIAQAVGRADFGIFEGYCFSEEELYELQVAALLHDCGKVTTPVHVVDKATKLETICDRIDHVQTRFEILKRDREINYLREAIQAGECGQEQLAEIESRLNSEKEKIDEDFAFIRKSNTGTEYMAPEKQQRIEKIGRDNRWCGPGGEELQFLSEEEIENLTVAKGTLTESEREVINYHVVATVKMLEKLPFPKGLHRVPDIAGAHHERMDGKGYPLGLVRDDITLQGRILGLADIFEALTAADRPYKEAKTISESLRILAYMTAEGHVDPELFELFVREEVYMEYAKQHLTPPQFDEVDVEKLLSIALPKVTS